MKVLSSEQMRNIDRRAIEQFGIPSIVLMENASRAVAEALIERFPQAETAAIFCGPGMNGGDGFGAARHLLGAGVTPLLFVVGEREKYTGDALTNLRICERLSLPIYDVRDTDTLDHALARASQTDVIVDAIFGTGLNRPAADLYADAIRGMSSLRLPIVAIDLPSGLTGSEPVVWDPAIRADVTVTFVLPKIPHIFEPAATYCGEIVVADISIPQSAIESERVTLSMVSPADVLPLVRPRDASTHKGTYGHVAILSGSAGKSGAAILGARGAIRAGAGLVTVLTDAETAKIVDAASVESMTLVTAYTLDSVAAILGTLERFSSAMIGPGLPDEEASYEVLRELVKDIEVPLVVDATAINAFAGDAESINPSKRARVLTPHPGELSRLIGVPTWEINRNRIEVAKETARRTASVVVVKGHQTVVADPAGDVAVNPTGNAGMATGGMGDVLAGVITALLAAGHDPFDAARAGVYLHGLAGDILAEEACDIGLAAHDLADAIPHAIVRVRETVEEE